MEEVPNLINICPTNPIQVLNLHEFFEDFVYVLQMILLTKLKKLWYGYLLHSKDRTSTRDKSNIGNPKVNGGCTHSQPHLSRLWSKFIWTLNTIYSTECLPYWGFRRYDDRWVPFTMASAGLWCFLWCQPAQTAEKTNKNKTKKPQRGRWINMFSWSFNVAGFASRLSRLILMPVKSSWIRGWNMSLGNFNKTQQNTNYSPSS